MFFLSEKTTKDGKEIDEQKEALYFQVLNHEKYTIKSIIIWRVEIYWKYKSRLNKNI